MTVTCINVHRSLPYFVYVMPKYFHLKSCFVKLNFLQYFEEVFRYVPKILPD